MSMSSTWYSTLHCIYSFSMPKQSYEPVQQQDNDVIADSRRDIVRSCSTCSLVYGSPFSYNRKMTCPKCLSVQCLSCFTQKSYFMLIFNFLTSACEELVCVCLSTGIYDSCTNILYRTQPRCVTSALTW